MAFFKKARALAGACVVGALLSMSAGAPAVAQEDARVIVVTGEGRASAAPDMAIVRLGVTAQAPQAQTAMDQVSEEVRAIFQALVDFGVAPRDIQTTRLSLDPVWDNSTRQSSGAPEISGFVATNDIALRLRDMTSLGAVLQEVLDRGANRFYAIEFTLSDPSPLRDAARRDAVADAKAKAALYADAAGVTLGAVLKITEAGASAPAPMMMAEARMAMSSAVPVAGGELDLTARVTLTYALQN
ncbi:SIMPL domain-containing protein [Roseobacteraceae bacterium S113]